MPVQPSLPSTRVPRLRRTIRRTAAACVASSAALLIPALWAGAAVAPIDLGTATSAAVLAGAGITNTGPTTITGDVGSHPTATVTGSGEVTLDGAYLSSSEAEQAKTDLGTAYVTAAGFDATDVAVELGGLTLQPGVYGNETLGITGTLTLDTLGDPNAVFIFQAGSTLITAEGSQVIVLGGGTACNVFWQIGSSATLGTDSVLIGTVMASAAITAGTGATIEGRLLAQTESVTLDSNTITRPTCAATTGGTDGTDGTTGGGTTTDGTTDGGTTDGATDGGTTDGTTDGGTTDGATDGGTTTDGAIPDGTGTNAGSGQGTLRTPGQAPGEPSGGAPGDGTSDSSTFTGQSRPGLPATGSDLSLALLGAALVSLGALSLRGARHRRAQC